MTELEKIKTELNALETRVNQALENQAKYTFTEKQLIEFTRSILNTTLNEITDQIKGVDIDDDVVELEFDSYSKKMEVYVSKDSIVDAVLDVIMIDTVDDGAIKDMIDVGFSEFDGGEDTLYVPTN